MLASQKIVTDSYLKTEHVEGDLPIKFPDGKITVAKIEENIEDLTLTTQGLLLFFNELIIVRLLVRLVIFI